MSKKDLILKDAACLFLEEEKQRNEVKNVFLKIVEVNPFYILVTDSHHIMPAVFSKKSFLDKKEFRIEPDVCMKVKKAEIKMNYLELDATSLREKEEMKKKEGLTGIEVVTEIEDKESAKKGHSKPLTRPIEDIQYSYAGIELVLHINDFSKTDMKKYKEKHGLMIKEEEKETPKEHTRNLFEEADLRTSILHYKFKTLKSGIKICKKEKKTWFSPPSFKSVYDTKVESDAANTIINIKAHYDLEDDEEENTDDCTKSFFLDLFDGEGGTFPKEDWPQIAKSKKKSKIINIYENLIKHVQDKAEIQKKYVDKFTERVTQYITELDKERKLNESKVPPMEFIKLPKALRPKKESAVKSGYKRNLFAGEKRRLMEEHRPKINFNPKAPKDILKVIENIQKVSPETLDLSEPLQVEKIKKRDLKLKCKVENSNESEKDIEKDKNKDSDEDMSEGEMSGVEAPMQRSSEEVMSGVETPVEKGSEEDTSGIESPMKRTSEEDMSEEDMSEIESPKETQKKDQNGTPKNKRFKEKEKDEGIDEKEVKAKDKKGRVKEEKTETEDSKIKEMTLKKVDECKSKDEYSNIVNVGKIQNFILWVIEKGSRCEADTDSKRKKLGTKIVRNKLEDIAQYYPKKQDFTLAFKGKTFEILGKKHTLDFGETVESSKELFML
ncbi:unnamed protein product [Moneuplotes crassus]|uniref:Uncharacterized protein n=1 Tax=Euplotes crassus TaxID=5936 RepID=A0AAD1X2K4_EUPCR|nr:unnamed protein product [Moneuplotes crassus]